MRTLISGGPTMQQMLLFWVLEPVAAVQCKCRSLAEAVCNMHITLLLIAPCDSVDSGNAKAKEKQSWSLSFHLAVLHTSWLVCICLQRAVLGWKID